MNKKSSADLFEKLSVRMWSIMDSMIDSSYQDVKYKKVVECMEHLKKWSIKEEEPLLFNMELIKFKGRYKEKIKKIWTMIVDKGVTLICIDDFDVDAVPEGLKVTKTESDQFLVEKVEENAEAVKVEENSDDDDF